MRPLRPSASVLAAILMVALTAFGRVKPQPVDAESLLIEYFRILESSNPEEELNRWTSSKSEPVSLWGVTARQPQNPPLL